jgi:hypothetical protein
MGMLCKSHRDPSGFVGENSREPSLSLCSFHEPCGICTAFPSLSIGGSSDIAAPLQCRLLPGIRNRLVRLVIPSQHQSALFVTSFSSSPLEHIRDVCGSKQHGNKTRRDFENLVRNAYSRILRNNSVLFLHRSRGMIWGKYTRFDRVRK